MATDKFVVKNGLLVGTNTDDGVNLVQVNGTISATNLSYSGTISGDGSGLTNVNATTLDSVDSTQFLRSDVADTKTAGDLSFADNVKAIFGAGNDLQIYHEGSNSYIRDAGTGQLRLQGNDVAIVNAANDEYMARFLENSSANLYHNGLLKLETSSVGITVTGSVTASEIIAASTDLDITGNAIISGNLTVNGTTTTLNTATVTTEDSVIVLNSGQTTPANDVGLILQRYSSPTTTNYNVAIAWDEGSDRLMFGATAETGADADITVSSEWMSIVSSGNVGIGTTSPQNVLHVAANDATLRLQTTSDTGEAGIEFWDNQSGTSQAAAIRYEDTNNLFTIQGNANGTIFMTPSNTFPSASEAMRITSSGNVGIGTTLPGRALSIGKAGNANGQLFFQATGSSSYGDAGVFNVNSNGDKIIFYNDGASYDARMGVGSVSNLWIKSLGESANEGVIELKAGGSIQFETGTTPAERMRIDSSGNVVIGTSNPITRLHVAQAGRPFTSTADKANGDMTGIVITSDTNENTMSGLWFSSGADHSGTHWSGISGSRSNYTVDWSTHLTFYTHVPSTTNITQATEKMRITGAGNVGIGTTSPIDTLHISDSSTSTTTGISTGVGLTLQNSSATDGNYTSIQNRDATGDQNAEIKFINVSQASQQGAIAFTTRSAVGEFAEKMRITSSGNVGIGTTNPTTALTVNGTVTATAFSGDGASVTNVNATTLDSLDSTQFLRSDANDTTTGTLTINTTGVAAAPSLAIDNTSTSTFIHSIEALGANMTANQTNLIVVGKEGSTKNSGYIGYNWAGTASDSNYVSIGHWGSDHLFRVYANGNITAGTNTIWHAGNDGTGSGLDADTVDGIQAASFLRSDADDTATGTIYLSDPYNRINTGNTSNTSTADTNGLYLHTSGYLDGRYTTRLRKRDESGGVPLYVDNSANTANVFTPVARFGSYTGNSHEFEVFGNTGINGNIYLTGTPTTTNQARTIHFTGFDKETIGDVSDAAYIQHTVNTLGHTGSVLVISSLNDAQDGIAFQTHSTSPLKHNSKNIPRIGVSDSAPGATNIVGDLWWDSDQGSLHIYYGSAWVEVNPYLGTTANPQFNSLGVGTAASGTTGEIRATNDVTAYYSDARLKDFEGTIDNAVDKVKQLNGYYFRENKLARNLGYNNPNRQVGVSAQEVQTILPEVVVAAPISDEYLTVKYEKMVPLLIEAIKEQQTMIDELREEIKKLKGDV